MNDKRNEVKHSNNNIFPLINKKAIKNYKSMDFNNIKINKKIKLLKKNDLLFNKANIINDLNNENNNFFSNKNIKSNINILYGADSNRTLRTKNNILLFNKNDNHSRNKTQYIGKNNLLKMKLNSNRSSSNIINSYEKYNNLQFNSNENFKNTNNIINLDNNINNIKSLEYNNSFFNIKNNSIYNINPNYTTYQNFNNSNNSINTPSKKINIFNKSHSLNKSSSYLFSCLLNKYNKSISKKIKRKIKNNSYKLSPFFKLSKDEKISARQIYKHYLLENRLEEKNKNKSKTKKKQKNIFNKGYDYREVICPKLKTIYGFNPIYMSRLYEIKKNNIIAYKNDFNIKEYQNTLLKLLRKKVSDKYLTNMQNKFKIFNEKNYGMLIPRGRYINLAEKLKSYLSSYAYEKLKKMDKNYKLYSDKKNKEKKEEIIDVKTLFKKIKVKKYNSL